MGLPTTSEILKETDRTVREQGRAGLCQVVRTEGSTPGKPGWKLLVRTDGTAYGNLGGGAFEALVKTDIEEKLKSAKPEFEIKRYYLTETATRGEATGMVCGGFAEVFLEVLEAKPLLIVCGGGPVGQALAHNAVLCDFDVVVTDDREEFRRPERFPEGIEIVAVTREHDEEFLSAYSRRTLYVAVVSRCWDTDLAALASVLRQRPKRLAYLGLMGSQRKVEKVVEQLKARNLDLPEKEFRAPIGMAIGGDQPGEIAVSILAEMIQVRSETAVSVHRSVADIA